jgi:hypothetical protein
MLDIHEGGDYFDVGAAKVFSLSAAATSELQIETPGRETIIEAEEAASGETVWICERTVTASVGGWTHNQSPAG